MDITAVALAILRRDGVASDEGNHGGSDEEGGFGEHFEGRLKNVSGLVIKSVCEVEKTYAGQ